MRLKIYNIVIKNGMWNISYLNMYTMISWSIFIQNLPAPLFLNPGEAFVAP